MDDSTPKEHFTRLRDLLLERGAGVLTIVSVRDCPRSPFEIRYAVERAWFYFAAGSRLIVFGPGVDGAALRLEVAATDARVDVYKVEPASAPEPRSNAA